MTSRFSWLKPSEREFPEPYRVVLERVVRVALWFAVVAVIVQTLVHGIAESQAFYYLSVNAENNPIAWAHAAAIAIVAFVSALHAITIEHRRALFVALALILAFLSLDEAISVHERIAGNLLELVQLPRVWVSVVWPILYIPIGGTVAVILVRVARDAPRSASRVILLGVGLLVAAVVAEIVTAPWTVGANLVHGIEGALEEGAEIAGWIALAAGLTTTTLADIVTAEGRMDERDERGAGAAADAPQSSPEMSERRLQ